MRIRYLAIRVAAVAAAAAALVLIALWLEHRTAVELPVPTGSYPVGRTHVARPDLALWIWYPAAAPGTTADYLPAEIRAEWQRTRPQFINFLTRDLSTVRAHSASDAAVSPVEPRYPVVIMRSGGSGSALNFSSLAEDLASHGYVVVGLDMAPTSNPELCVGRNDEDACAIRIMTPLVDGIGHAIDLLQALSTGDSRFNGTLDLTRVGVFGHSFGGAQAAEFCSHDSRCAAGANLDGRLFEGIVRSAIRVPFMFLFSDHGAADDPADRRIMEQIQAVYDRQPAPTRLRATIRGAHHFTFSDDGAVLKSALFRGLLRLFGKLHIEGRRQIEVTRYALRTFFDTHLKNRPSVLASPAFSELVVFR